MIVSLILNPFSVSLLPLLIPHTPTPPPWYGTHQFSHIHSSLSSTFSLLFFLNTVKKFVKTSFITTKALWTYIISSRQISSKNWVNYQLCLSLPDANCVQNNVMYINFIHKNIKNDN